jgi:hypothetical protein
MKSYEHLRDALPIDDPQFNDYWESYLRALPQFEADATIELRRDQLQVLFKLAFLAGREAAIDELDIAGTAGVEDGGRN